ncbi:hypothetical protein DL766_006153 [Monosporascus sp. MC13-8B]|uniref:Uncharacterized protein n=1 Tax=Monosporascus cannonballus TaxID=155416 RepID=A0ABY0HBC8_9PEZI|nr:hypothetical protein DL762_003326 [Monosporascus cannonballus]RYP00548.1 hypothetical protein DL763_000745 [Monosporascus cannonballus]RYP27909.1 hypothetical protein DL766_006153 [Monosporascus sp. MC13-8B]
MPSDSNTTNGTPNTSTGTKDWKPYTVPYTGGGAIPTDRGWVPSAWVVGPGAARAPSGLAFPAAAGSANAIVPGRDPEGQTRLHEPAGVYSVSPPQQQAPRSGTCERAGDWDRGREGQGETETKTESEARKSCSGQGRGQGSGLDAWI